MSYLEPNDGESFIFRVRKTVIDQPTVHWFNTYEARFQAIGTSEDLDSLAAGLVEFESTLLLAPYVIDQVTISTWLPDAHPYNPESFVTQPYNQAGQRATGGNDLLDLRVALFLKRQPQSGRIGRIFLRGSLTEADVTAPAGTFALEDAAAMATSVAGAVTAGGLNSNMLGGAAEPTLAMIGDEQVTRFLTGISLGGVAVIKLNHKYFDRA